MQAAATIPAKSASNSGRPKYELLSISKLAFRFDLDRATVRKRIAEARIEPVSVAAREKLYELTPRLEAVLEQIDAQLTEAKLRKESAQARIAELKVAEAEGELISVSEVEEYLQKLFRALHQEVCIRFPRQIARAVNNAPDAAAVAGILGTRLDSIFSRLREDHGSLMGKSRNGNGRGTAVKPKAVKQ